jgi:hypothetical protein
MGQQRVTEPVGGPPGGAVLAGADQELGEGDEVEPVPVRKGRQCRHGLSGFSGAFRGRGSITTVRRR